MARWRYWLVLGVLGGGCGDDASPSAVAEASGGAVASVVASVVATPKAERCPEAHVPLARRIGGSLAEVCEKAATVDPMQRDPSLDLTLSGAWAGEYASADLGASTTRFDASLSVFAGTVIGSTTEPNTFGAYGYAELEAGLTGDAYGTRQIVLLKTYRSGATTHSVLYVGRLDPAGKRIEGEWRVSGGTQGTFWMEKK